VFLFQGGIRHWGAIRWIVGNIRPVGIVVLLLLGPIGLLWRRIWIVRAIRRSGFRLSGPVGWLRLLRWWLLLRILVGRAIIRLLLIVRRGGGPISGVVLCLGRASILGLRRWGNSHCRVCLLSLLGWGWRFSGLRPLLLLLLLLPALNLLLFLDSHLADFRNWQGFTTVGFNGLLLLNKGHRRRRRGSLCDHRAVYDGLRRFGRGWRSVA
jgi:hypothetical protein